MQHIFIIYTLLFLCFINFAAYGSSNFSRILDRKVLRIAADIRTMPWYGFDYKEGKFEGFEYELVVNAAKLIAPDMQVMLIPATWEYIPKVVQSGFADVGLNGYFPDPDEKQFVWTKCYFSVSKRFIYHEKLKKEPTLDELKKMRIVVFPDAVIDTYMQQLGFTKYTKVSDDFTFLDLVAEKKVDAVIYDDVFFLYQLSKQKLPVKLSKTKLPHSENCYAAFAAKNNEQLIDALNKAFDAFLPTQEWKNILKKYGLVYEN